MSTPVHNPQMRYPQSEKLGLKFVQVPRPLGLHADVCEYPGYDAEVVEKMLGGRFAGFQAWLVKDGSGHMFSCGHRTKLQTVGALEKWVEVLCFYAADVENFLAGGN